MSAGRLQSPGAQIANRHYARQPWPFPKYRAWPRIGAVPARDALAREAPVTGIARCRERGPAQRHARYWKP